MDNIFVKRKANRLKEYDYSQNGRYFVTICTDKRKHILSKVSVGAIHESPAVVLTPYGKIINEIVLDIPKRFDVKLDYYVIMPNHLHLLIEIDEKRAIHESPLHSRSKLSKIIGYLKMNSSKRIHEFNPEIEIWQRSYYDHIIRDETDYMEKIKYIEANPAKWEEDEYFINISA